MGDRVYAYMSKRHRWIYTTVLRLDSGTDTGVRLYRFSSLDTLNPVTHNNMFVFKGMNDGIERPVDIEELSSECIVGPEPKLIHSANYTESPPNDPTCLGRGGGIGREQLN